MADGEVRSSDQWQMTEESFLKDLYLYMKKRDTAIERIPHLGFKQIDLFVMYKTVTKLGGYHQVTLQQLWKQVYNTLGGNPRSTSAATCTRRHYEKLLLPYECHVKGGDVSSFLPQPQSKHFHHKGDECQRPPKRRNPPMPRPQNPCAILPDSYMTLFSQPVQFPHYYHQGYPVLPSFIPNSSSVLGPRGPPAPQPRFSYPLPPQRSTENTEQPLEHLRYLAEQYKTSSGLAEPLNLSVKISSLETKSHPPSSFSSPPATKNPKFLNKPSPLYPHKRLRSDETKNTNVVLERSYLPRLADSCPVAAREDFTHLKTPSIASSASAPTPRAENTGPAMGSAMCNSLKIQCPTRKQEEKEENPKPSPRVLNLSCALPCQASESTRKMEIQIPLAVLQNWIKMYGPSSTKQLPGQEGNGRVRSSSETDVSSYALSSQGRPRDHVQDTNPSQRNMTFSTPTNLTTRDAYNTDLYRVPSSFQTLPSTIKDLYRQGTFPCNQQDILKWYHSKTTNVLDSYSSEGEEDIPLQMKVNPSPFAVKQDFGISKVIVPNEDMSKGEVVDGSEKGSSSSVFMLNSNSASLLQLTSEEFVKLKKIISTS